MSQFRKLPIGIEDFEEIRSENFYYVDKTKLIEQLLDFLHVQDVLENL